MEENWLVIPDYPDYEVSNQGNVRSSRLGKCKLLKPSGKKYLKVLLYNEAGRRYFAIHQLVLHVFVGPQPHGLDVRHLDGNKLNNALSNLEYGTRLDNAKDSCLHGTSVKKLDKHKVRIIRSLHRIGFSQKRLCEIFDVTKATMWRLIHRKIHRYV